MPRWPLTSARPTTYNMITNIGISEEQKKHKQEPEKERLTVPYRVDAGRGRRCRRRRRRLEGGGGREGGGGARRSHPPPFFATISSFRPSFLPPLLIYSFFSFGSPRRFSPLVCCICGVEGINGDGGT